MRKKKMIKGLVSGIMACCLMLTGMTFAAEPVDTTVAEDGIQVFTNGEAVPYSMYFRSCSLDMGPLNGVMAVNVKTKAFQNINHIYHDVTIYKNGSFYSSNRYEAWNDVSLNTYIKVPANSGDYIEVYVDHYTEHNGYVESASTSKTSRF